jgi:hypothetical protein
MEIFEDSEQAEGRREQPFPPAGRQPYCRRNCGATDLKGFWPLTWSGEGLTLCGIVQVDPMAEAPFEQVGKAFVQHYYQTFDTNRAGLGNLYQAESM